MDFLSTRRESDELHIQVLAGDLNMREGEEQCLLQQGWKDAWTSRTRRNAAEDWTWKKGESSMRFDRCYVHSRRYHHHVFPRPHVASFPPKVLANPRNLENLENLEHLQDLRNRIANYSTTGDHLEAPSFSHTSARFGSHS